MKRLRSSPVWRSLPVAGFLLFFPYLTDGASARAEEPVDLELVLAVDVSGSIDYAEARLQRNGYLEALVDPKVIAAIRGGFHRRIAVTYVEWAGFGHFNTVVGWSVIEDEASAEAFTAQLAEAPIDTASRTSVSDAILKSIPLFSGNGYESLRKVIDISGDGPNNYGPPVVEARDAAVAAGITINGLPILGDPAGLSQPSLADLDLYYRDCVIGGPGSFYIVARGFEDFAAAIRRKLILEIAGNMPPQAPERLWRASERPTPPCDIGEMRWRNRTRDQ